MKQKKEVPGELIYGIHPLVELLKARQRKVLAIYTTKPVPKAWNKISVLIDKTIPIQYVDRTVLNKMAGCAEHQGVVAWVQKFPFRKKFFEPAKNRFLLLLDSIQDPRNLGAIIRSAYCTGVDGIIICKRSGAPLNAAAIKASAGLVEYMPILEAPSTEWAAQKLKEAGYTLYLATLDGKNATQQTYQEPLCLVIGNEAVGISKEIFSYGQKITLAQRTTDISYNASVAAGILLFTIALQNKKI